MARLFTTLFLLFTTVLLFSQKPSFKGASLKSNFDESPELQYQFKDWDVFQIDVTAFDTYVKDAGDYMEFNLQLGSEYDWDISLYPRDIRKPGYMRRVVTDEGIKILPPEENITFRGHLDAPGGGSVALTVDDNFIYGFVKNDGGMYFIEPLWYFLKDQPKDLFVIYSASDVQPRPGVKCGAEEMAEQTLKFLQHDNDDDGHGHGEEGQKMMGCLEVEIAIASDELMFNKYGSGAAVEAQETAVLNNVQTNYDDEFNDELQFFISEFFTVTTSGGDPWTNSTSAGALLGSFRSWGNSGGFAFPYDVAGLWTNRNFNGGTVGIAYLNGICNNSRYHCLQDFTSNSNLLRVLWSHELGHNFSATHDAPGSGTIMAPSVNNTNTWSGQSLSQINGYYPTRNCLTTCPGLSAPIANFSGNPTSGCVPLTVQFTDLSLNNPTSWSWTFAGGTPSSSSQQNPIVTYNVAGVFDVSLIATNSVGNDEFTLVDYIVVDDVPLAVFGFDQVDLTMIFDNNSLNATSYSWDFGDGNTSTEENPVHVYAFDDFYDVTLTASNSCGDNIFTINIPVFTPPAADFMADPITGCAPLEVEFTSTGSPNAIVWFWEFEGGTPATSGAEDPVVNYSAPGIYDVKLTVSNPAGDNSKTIADYIFVGTIPTPGFSSAVNVDTVTFVNQSDNSQGIGPMTFLWDFGDGDTSTLENPTHVYATNGMFNVTLEATNDCGTATVNHEVVIETPPSAGFSAPVTVGCPPFSVTFENLSSSNTTSYEWDFPGGDPDSSTVEEPTVIYNTPGTYDVTLIAFNTAGSDTVTFTDYITVNPLPSPSFTSDINGLTVDFTNSSTEATSYIWNFGDSNTSTDVDPSHTYADDGTYEVVLSAINNCDTVTSTQTIVVVTAPVAAFSSNVTTGCAPLTVEFINQSSANAVDYDWDFPGGDPSSSTDENPTVVYNSAGTYTVTLTVTNSVGSNSVTVTNYIIVDTVPVAGYTSTSNGLTVDFDNTSTNATSYSWDFGDGNTSTEEDPSHTYDDDGTYAVELTATNDCGSVTTTETVVVVTVPTAGFSANSSTGCSPLTVQFSNQSSVNATDFDWDFPGGDPASSTDENPTVVYNDPGTYDVTLIVSNAAGSDTVTMIGYVVVNTVPDPSYTVSTNVFVATFTNTTIGATSYSWDFGDGESSTETNPVHEYGGDGTYTVVLTATNDCGTMTYTSEVVVTSLPQAGFTTAQTVGCSSFTVEFEDQSSSNTTSWEWEFPGGDPSSSTDQNPTVVYDNVGTYTVTLTASNSLGENTVTQTDYITVITTPTPSFTSVNNLLTVNFTNTTTGATSYSWDFGDGNTSSDENPTHTYDDDGTYEVELTATNDCGSTTTTETVVVVSMPTAGFSANENNGCAPFTVEFANQSSANATSYDWDFPGGNPSTSTDENPTVTYNAAGTYDVTLIASNAAGNDTVTIMDYVVVGDVPNTSFTADVNGFTVQFMNTSTNPPNSGNATFEWDFGDGNMSTEENPEHTYDEDGTYEVTLIVTNDCGSKTINGQFTVVSLPTAGFSAEQTTGCEPFEVHFSNESTTNAESFEWEFPGGMPATSSDENPVIIYNTPGIYDVTLTVSNAAGDDTETLVGFITVEVLPSPGFGFTVNGSQAGFTNESTNTTSVSWDFGDNETSTENDPVHTYMEDGAYTVTLIATNDCGSVETTQIVVIATEGPIAAFTTESNEGCLPFEVTFVNLSSGNTESFLWTFEGGDPATSTEENPIVNYNAVGSFNVVLIAFNGLGSDTFSIDDYIIVETTPVPSFSADDDMGTVTFTNNSTNATSFEWDFGDGESSTEENPVHTYAASGEYEVTLTATNDCGFSANTQTIAVNATAVGEIPGISEFNIFPNPNNGRFTLVLQGEALGELQVSFTNLLGQVIMQDQVDFRSGNITRDFAFNDLTAGMYIFQLKSGNKALYRKIVVE